MSDRFNFLDEIGKPGTYSALFPPPHLGLAVMELHSKLQAGVFLNGRFREADALAALEAARLKTGEFERAKKSTLLSELTKLHAYFLRYDDVEQAYSLKEYAHAFCARAAEVLEEAFSPTQIQIICSSLREKLEACGDDDEKLSQWISIHFEPFKPKMSQQVDYLDEQVNKSVAQIRIAMRTMGADIVTTLKDIGERLDGIRAQSGELLSAFGEMRHVNRLLDEKLAAISDEDLREEGERARQFFPRIRAGLHHVDRRLERVQPKLRLLFSALRKPTFMAQTEAFLNFLLEHSTLVPQGSRKALQLPSGVPSYCVRGTAPHFTIVERRENFLPKLSREIVRPQESAEALEKAALTLQAKLDMQRHTAEWVNRIYLRAKNEGTLNFSTVFFQIVAEAGGATELAVKVGHALLRADSLRQKISVETTTDLVISGARNLAVWEMKIQAIS